MSTIPSIHYLTRAPPCGNHQIIGHPGMQGRTDMSHISRVCLQPVSGHRRPLESSSIMAPSAGWRLKWIPSGASHQHAPMVWICLCLCVKKRQTKELVTDAEQMGEQRERGRLKKTRGERTWEAGGDWYKGKELTLITKITDQRLFVYMAEWRIQTLIASLKCFQHHINVLLLCQQSVLVFTWLMLNVLIFTLSAHFMLMLWQNKIVNLKQLVACMFPPSLHIFKHDFLAFTSRSI